MQKRCCWAVKERSQTEMLFRPEASKRRKGKIEMEHDWVQSQSGFCHDLSRSQSEVVMDTISLPLTFKLGAGTEARRSRQLNLEIRNP